MHRLMVSLWPGLVIGCFGLEQIDRIYSDCVFSDSNYCLSTNDTDSYIFEHPAVMHNVLAKWTFDDLYPVDGSGHFYNLHPRLGAGPDRRGSSGGSLTMEPEVAYTTSPKTLTHQGDFTIVFSLFLGESIPQTRSFLSVGNGLHILFLAKQGNRAEIHLVSGQLTMCPTDIQDSFTFPGGVLEESWTNIVITQSSGIAIMYINGNQVHMGHLSNELQGPIVFGKGICPGITGFADDVTIMASSLGEAEIMAYVPGIYRNNMRLFAANATQSETGEICHDGWKICSQSELWRDNVYSLVRSLALLPPAPSSTRVWATETLELGYQQGGGIMMCCRDEHEIQMPRTGRLNDCII